MAQICKREEGASCSIPDDSAVEACLDRIAEKARLLKLEAPLLFFLEAHLPCTTLLHTAGLFLEPVSTPLFGAERIDMLRTILSDRRYVEALMERLEGRRPIRPASGN